MATIKLKRGTSAPTTSDIADGEVAKGIVGYNPIIAGQLTKEEIELSSKDKSRSLKINNYFSKS